MQQRDSCQPVALHFYVVISEEPMKKIVTAAALIAALALTGCTAYEVTPGPSVVPAVEPTQGADGGQAWADSKINEWLGSNGARNISALSGPTFYVDSWESPAEGELVVRTMGGAYDKVALGMVASSILHGTGEDMQKITAINEYGKIQATYERLK